MGKKSAKQFFRKHSNNASNKCWEKNRRKKVRKTFFYIHTNIVTKKWVVKTKKTIFPETHDSGSKKWKKYRLKKVRKKVFYIHTNIVTKKNARNTFFRNTRIVRAKNVGKKYPLKKVRKNVFYIHTNIVIKKWGDKTSETIFPETHD